MKTEIILADKGNGFIIKNMYPLYLHDLAGIHGTLPNRYGIFEEGEVKTLQEQYDIQQAQFEHPGELFAYIIMADSLPAGFCMIGSGRYVPEDVDFCIYETFILNPFRRRGIASNAVKEILNRHHGRWMLFTQANEKNEGALRFWQKNIESFTGGDFIRMDRTIDSMPKKVFLFTDQLQGHIKETGRIRISPGKYRDSKQEIYEAPVKSIQNTGRIIRE